MATFSAIIVVEPGDDTRDPSNLLATAIRSGNVPRVQDLLPRQNMPLGFGLLQAASCGHRDVLELLLDAVTQTSTPPQQLVASTDALGRSPLHFAAANGDYGAAQLLLSRGADVNAVSRDGMSPVAYAAAGGHRGLMELLLDGGGEVDHRDAEGATPLLLAAEAGHSHCVEALLRRGADPNAADVSGLTPLLAALAGGYRRTAEALLSAGAQPGGPAGGRTALHWAAYHGMTRVLRLLLEGGEGADIDAEDSEGDTSLLLAARRGHQPAVELLLQHGASVDKANRGGITPLMVAALFGHDGTAEALLSRGAALSASDVTHRRMPLHWAAMADSANTARMLLQHGADGRAVDAHGTTAMDLAVEHDCQSVVQVFVSLATNS